MPIHMHCLLFLILEVPQILTFCLSVLSSSDHTRLGLRPICLVATQHNEVGVGGWLGKG